MTTPAQMTLAQALDAAPPTPACFPGRREWAEFLLDCQAEKHAVRRPFTDRRAYRPSFNFCAYCLPDHATAMAQAGRCNPKQFRIIPVKHKEAA